MFTWPARDAESGKELLTLRGHSGSVYGVAFSPDGTCLVTASQDGTVQIYVLDLREVLNLARSRVTRPFTCRGVPTLLPVEDVSAVALKPTQVTGTVWLR